MKNLRRIFMLLIAAAGMLLASGASFAAQKEQESRAVAIVFDNSGSMYGTGNSAWCRATYATEVFTSMANEGDLIEVFPMNPVTIDGRTYTGADPIILNAGSDAYNVRKMFTPDIKKSITPIETIREAYEGLQHMQADEKWLIVLTDGEIFYENGEPLSSSDTAYKVSEELKNCSSAVNIMYLGIGAGAIEPEIPEGGSHIFYSAKAKESEDVLMRLTEMSNMIFGRDSMPVSDDRISSDIDIKNLILFVQGKNITGLRLLDSSGNEAAQSVFTYSPKYSELGCDTKFKVDDSLSGMIVSYSDIEAGEYTIAYEGKADSCEAYYEPDVDLLVFLVDEYGNPVTSFDRVYPGKYRLTYGLVDQDGDLTESELLGNRHFSVRYSIDGNEQEVSSQDNGFVDIELGENTNIQAVIEAEYLSGYKITKTSDAFGWPEEGLNVIARPSGTLESSFSGGEDTYTLSELSENGTYTMQFYYDGRLLTGDELDRVSLDVSWEGPRLGYTVEKTSDSLLLRLGFTDGRAENTEAGKYKLHVTADYENQYGKISETDVGRKNFRVRDREYSFKAIIKPEQKYYQISKIDESKPIPVILTHNGEHVSPEQVEQAEASIDLEGLKYTLEKDPDGSALLIYIDPDQEIKPGKISMKAEVNTVDDVGRPVSSDDSSSIRFGRLPQWMLRLALLIAILIIVLLIAGYMNQKVLPDVITVENNKSSFKVNGEAVPGNCNVKYSGKGKKTGTLTIEAPKLKSDSSAKCGFSFDLEAVSPRKLRSSKREAAVTRITPIGRGVNSIKVGGYTTEKDEDGIWSGGKGRRNRERPDTGKDDRNKKKDSRKSAEPLTKLGIKTCHVKGEVDDMMYSGSKKDLQLDVSLKFK
ncbi:MAG: hypothetical protein PUC98_01325 [Clostridiales bacterium]|nr:hypothetical protein [Clostridiales bacterium]